MKDYTLEDLLVLSKTEREAVIKKLNTKQKQTIYHNVPTLTTILDLDKIADYTERVRMREAYILDHPNEVHWDYGEYINLKGEHFFLPFKISTNGDMIVYTLNYRLTILSNAVDLNSYPHKRYKDISYKNRRCALNRMVACTFISMPDRLKNVPFNLLVANHKNGIKLDNRLSNLEWTSQTENILHGAGVSNYIGQGKLDGDFDTDAATLAELSVSLSMSNEEHRTPIGPFKLNVSKGPYSGDEYYITHTHDYRGLLTKQDLNKMQVGETLKYDNFTITRILETDILENCKKLTKKIFYRIRQGIKVKLFKLDNLLKTDKRQRNKLLNMLDTAETEVIYNTVQTLTEILGLDKIESYEGRVRLRAKWIDAHPNEIWWDYVEYVDSKGSLLKSRYKISTNGDAILFNDNKRLSIISNADREKEAYKKINIDRRRLLLHRAVCSTFCSVPKDLKEIGIGNLSVNHISGKITDNSLHNLEWLTHAENIKHGYKLKRHKSQNKNDKGDF